MPAGDFPMGEFPPGFFHRGDPSSDAFDGDAHLEGLSALAGLGVTWVQIGLPGDSVAHAVETLERYGDQVIRRL